jgi:hypothetical protein
MFSQSCSDLVWLNAQIMSASGQTTNGLFPDSGPILPIGNRRFHMCKIKGKTRQELSSNIKEDTNMAWILSVDEDVFPNTFRVSLQWQGHHDIADFELERYGKVLSIQDEAENRGWAIIERPFRTALAQIVPGWAMNQSIYPLKPGGHVPLRGA